MPSPESYSPAALGRRWGKKPESIISLIRAGRLRGLNLANSTSSRPRYRILAADVERFENERSATPTRPVPRTRRKKPGQVIEFF